MTSDELQKVASNRTQWYNPGADSVFPRESCLLRDYFFKGQRGREDRMANVKKTAEKAVRYLMEKGIRETARRTALHFGRKRAEKSFVRKMQLSPEELERQRAAVFSRPLRFSVVVPLYNTPEDLLKETIDSVCQQTYDGWELCLADGSDEAHSGVGKYCLERAEAESRILYRKLEKNGGISENTNACLEMATGDYIALFDHDDLLMPNALYEMRSAIEKTNADFLYSDEMIFRSPRRDKPAGIRMKPGFSPDSLRANNYICHLTVFSRELLEKTGGFRKAFDGSQDHDMILRLTDRAERIAHISKVLYLWRSIPGSTASDIRSKTYAIDAGRSAVESFLRERRGISARVESTEVFPTMYRVFYPIGGEPGVRVIVDARRELGSIEEKIKALKASAGWEKCSWTVLEGSGEGPSPRNGTGRPEYESIVLPPQESRRAAWNLAGGRGEEEYLLFVDGIPEAKESGWLKELLSHAQLEHTGAVGPKIHFARGDVRHAGVVIGMGPEGVAGRAYYMADADSAGYFGQMAVVENVAAVTDCLMVSREKWKEAGGFSDKYGDALFDVDFCLRLLEKGYYNVFTPHACLKLGKAKDTSFDVGKEYAGYAKDAAAFRSRNDAWLKAGDPCFNPNLSLKYEDWRIRKQK